MTKLIKSLANFSSSLVALTDMAALAANSIIGNNTGSPATPLALTTAQVKTLLAIAQADVSGLTTSSSPTFAGLNSGEINIATASSPVTEVGLTMFNPSIGNGSGTSIILGPYNTSYSASISCAGYPTSTYANYLWLQSRLGGGSLGNGLYISPTDKILIGTQTDHSSEALQINGSVFISSQNPIVFANAQTIKDNGGGGLAINSAGYKLQLIGGTDPTNGIVEIQTNNTVRMSISNTGALTLPSYTAGTLHSNASGNITSSLVVESDISLSNNTTNNVSTSKHGFAPIAPNDATKYLDGTGAYSVPASSAPFNSQNSVAGSRVLGTSYQNTSGKTMFVVVSAHSTIAINLIALSDSSNPSGTQVAAAEALANNDTSVSFMVLTGNYYKVTSSTGSNTLSSWTEWY